MKVPYVFAAPMASAFKLSTMILPQLEDGTHGANVIGVQAGCFPQLYAALGTNPPDYVITL